MVEPKCATKHTCQTLWKDSLNSKHNLNLLLYILKVSWAWEIVQWVRGFVSKHESLSSNCRTHIKSQAWPCVHVISTLWDEKGQSHEIPDQPTYPKQQTSGSVRIRQKAREEDTYVPLWPLNVYVWVHVPTKSCVYLSHTHRETRACTHILASKCT